ncbi:uncharacterized protein EDB91DRAFT_1143523 [Suillus paluster]|uniref:uncharacterized protein n=1 Tax=Suillus paluster TaxID=48578 RepID=UPI001B85C0E7|nr:uncharacterized protein EDB91DRAFT_1143523 [Suillus paluster]KAG1735921.1 hypothetical protein EDB91DRAFT_1143523 [Suillus paluster]
MQTVNSNVDFSPVPDIVGALQTILARSQVIIPIDLDTPYAKFPNTDHSAIELKDQSISAIITERQQQLDAVLHDISGLQIVMDNINNLRQQLVKKKDKITQSMNLHKGLVSALWRFPTEVLSHIFERCLPEFDEWLPPLNQQAPMLLSQVCRRWRGIAVGTSNLWCRLCMGNLWQRVPSCCDSWLKRSQGRPLSLALHPSHINHLDELRSLLQPYINQISSLSIGFCCSDCLPEVVIADFPALQELTISMDNPIPAVTPFISQLPFTLRSLKVTQLSLNLEDLSLFNPVWARLTNVEIDICQPNAFPQLLHLCPDLSSLTIAVEFRGTQVLEPFTHTKLQSLCISDSFNTDTTALSGLFNALSLPNLRALEARYVQQWPHEGLKAFLTRSNCPLESLVFGAGVRTTDEQRAEYVALIPSLQVVVDSNRGCFA